MMDKKIGYIVCILGLIILFVAINGSQNKYNSSESNTIDNSYQPKQQPQQNFNPSPQRKSSNFLNPQQMRQIQEQINNLPSEYELDRLPQRRQYRFYSETPDDAYSQGYDNGYEQGRYDGLHGYSHGYGYDDSSGYYDYYETRYQEGYEEGYEEGYSSGHNEYEDNQSDDDDDNDDW